MDKQWSFLEIKPEGTYSVSEAARYLGVHRCTLYSYVCNPDCPLPFIRHQDNERMLFKGADLIAYKAAGLPKKGRKNGDGGRNQQGRKPCISPEDSPKS